MYHVISISDRMGLELCSEQKNCVHGQWSSACWGEAH
ncbi:hypothetical protein PRUPE_5G173500 [Prunus persica]|uniref:Uncharacterized protein n=1 Tax=Prunus persica TaxID=3760 RepID=A0A251PD93_PRUPE|nr:hypothetical protein PRUPE_5G173500 [Prunus persica]